MDESFRVNAVNFQGCKFGACSSHSWSSNYESIDGLSTTLKADLQSLFYVKVKFELFWNFALVGAEICTDGRWASCFFA